MAHVQVPYRVAQKKPLKIMRFNWNVELLKRRYAYTQCTNCMRTHQIKNVGNIRASICSLHKKVNFCRGKKTRSPYKDAFKTKKNFFFGLNKRQFSWSMWIFMSLRCYCCCCCCCKNHEFGVRFFHNIFLVVSKWSS